MCAIMWAKRHHLARQRWSPRPNLRSRPSYRPPHQDNVRPHCYERDARGCLVGDRQVQQAQTYLSDPAAKILWLGDEQIDIRLAAQGSLEFFRVVECGRAAARHPRSLCWFGQIEPRLHPPTGAGYAFPAVDPNSASQPPVRIDVCSRPRWRCMKICFSLLSGPSRRCAVVKSFVRQAASETLHVNGMATPECPTVTSRPSFMEYRQWLANPKPQICGCQAANKGQINCTMVSDSNIAASVGRWAGHPSRRPKRCGPATSRIAVEAVVGPQFLSRPPKSRSGTADHQAICE